MKYKSADQILPESLVRELQKYIQSEYLYIPRSKEQKKEWGECSGIKKELKNRNEQIRIEYKNGISINSLSDRYCLSEYTIKKIIYTR